MITPAELAEIKARADAAVPGPWVATEFADSYGWDLTTPGEACWIANGGDDGAFDEKADAVFAAAARLDVPRLVAEVERLNSLLERYRSESKS